MRFTVIGLVLCAVVLQGVASAADDPVMAPIHKFIVSFNSGDADAAAATHAAGTDLSIIDEVPPYQWHGPQAFKAWSADLMADSTKRGISDQAVTLGEPTRVEMDGERAYVVVPATYTFTQKGTAMREAAQMTFSLKKEDGGWMIHGWTWTGPKPQPAPPPPK
jgi:ketosteroid isomerase-like protein